MRTPAEATQAAFVSPVAPVATTCPYCGVGCGLLVTPQLDGTAVVTGDPTHPANLGRICSKGAALGETLSLDDRLLYPEIAGERVMWPAALDAVAGALTRIHREHGPQAIAFYVSGQLLTEDYYVANKLMKGFLGSANIDTNSRLCMASAVAGHKRAFGADVVPGCYEDLELADLVVLVGSNTAWCHPVLYQRIAAAKERNPNRRVIVVDPRRTATCELADLHLQIRPGTDGVLFNGLLAHMERIGTVDHGYIEAHTSGFKAAVAEARRTAPDIETVAALTGVHARDVATFYRWFGETPRVVTAFSQGINQSSSGTDKVNAIINCHLATGRIGLPGAGPFSLTGQPNAMGGREVGGMANQLAAHLDFDRPGDADRLRRFWGVPQQVDGPGLKAVDLFRAVKDGRIKAVWIMATNPADSMPDADAVVEALDGCELVIVSDCVRHTDTTRCADILLPAAAWGEKSGTVTNSERRISRQRAFLPAPGEAKPDWWIVTEVARRMGFTEAFPYDTPADVLREHAALTAFENNGSRALNLQALARLSDTAYDALTPVQWPVTTAAPNGTDRMFSDGRFCTPDGKARFIAVTPQSPARDPVLPGELVFNTGRARDQWHTMTRTGKTSRLTGHTPEPRAELHPIDAAALQITDGAWVRVSSGTGQVLARALIADSQQPGAVFVPIHWNGQTAKAARVGGLIPGVVDPYSDQPELKHAVVRVEPLSLCWEAEVHGLAPIHSHAGGPWVTSRLPIGWRTRLAGEASLSGIDALCEDIAARMPSPGEWIAVGDVKRQRFRAALMAGDRLLAHVAVQPSGTQESWDWVQPLLARNAVTDRERRQLLSGLADVPEQTDRIVCSCHAVGAAAIDQAITRHGLTSVGQVGQLLKAGTQCGSCLPELRKMLGSAQRIKVAV